MLCASWRFFTLGTAVENMYFHSVFSPSASQFYADIFIINPCGSHVNPRSAEWIISLHFFCQNRGLGGRVPQQAMQGVFTILVGTSYRSSFPKWIKVRNSLISTLLMNAIPIQDGVFILKAHSAKDYLTLS